MEKYYKGVQSKLYPNTQQKQQLNQSIGNARFVYNHFLNLKKEHYQKTGETLSRYDLQALLPALKATHPWLQLSDSQSLQVVLLNLDNAYKNFFRRATSGGVPGFPRFKRKSEMGSFSVTNQTSRFEGNKVKIGKLGWFRFRGNLSVLESGKLKSITVKCDAGSYYASSLIEVDGHSKLYIHQYQEAIGVDLGVAKPLTLSSASGKEGHLGMKFSRDLRDLETKRKRYQRKMQKKQKGSNNRHKAKTNLQRAFQKERNFRKNFVEQTSYALAYNYETVVFEDLKIQNMTRAVKKTLDGSHRKNVKAKSGLNREMLRLGLSNLITRTEQKANALGGYVVTINPKYTSQTCSECGSVDKASRKTQSLYHCVHCGFRLNADMNAARNIRELA